MNQEKSETADDKVKITLSPVPFDLSRKLLLAVTEMNYIARPNFKLWSITEL